MVITSAPQRAEPADWVSVLTTGGRQRDDALRALHTILVRVAHTDARRRAAPLRLAGPELEDLAQQAADDALVAITTRLGLFRGESRFTTWACGFAVRQVGTKIDRHRWHREPLADDAARWLDIIDGSARPDAVVEWRELVAAVHAAIETRLTERQREVFLALVVHGVPVAELSDRLGANRNALYQLLFAARRRIRAALVAEGLIHDAARSA